jgi:hypothetical protein
MYRTLAKHPKKIGNKITAKIGDKIKAGGGWSNRGLAGAGGQIKKPVQKFLNGLK